MNNDRLLAEKVLRGETQAFGELITSYYPGLYGFLIKMGVPDSRAGDLAQSIFVDIFRNLYRYNDRWAFSTWFYRMAYDRFRKDKQKQPRMRHPRIPEYLIRHDDESEEEKSLGVLLDPLHDEDRAMLILHYDHGLTLREIGRVFGLSGSSARMRMDRALGFLAGNVQTSEDRFSEAVERLIGRISRKVPCETVPEEAIMDMAEKEAGRKPGFIAYVTSPVMLRKIWPIAVPAFLGVLLLALLVVQDVSKPFWGSVMTIFDKDNRPALADTPFENTGTPISFTSVTGLLSGDELVARLNETGMDATSWEVLHANQEQFIIRIGHIIVSCRNDEFRQLIDLESIGLSVGQGEPEFSVAPTGAFMVVGIPGTKAGAGTYLFNLSDGSYYRLSEMGPDQVVCAWSPLGNYLAYAGSTGAGPVSLLDMHALQLMKIESAVAAAKLFVTNNGGIGVFSGDQAMFASADDAAWKTQLVQHEPFYINPDSGTIWYVLNGVIMKHVTANDQDTAIVPDSGAGNGGSQDAYITDYRLSGNYLVFKMRNGNSGTLNLRTGKISVFNTSRELRQELLPWCRTTASGARVMFDNDGSFLIVSESSVTAPRIPGYSELKPYQTNWVDEENIAYVRMIDETDPKAGEFSIYTINVLTGAVTEVFRSVDREPVLNNDDPAAPNNASPAPGTQDTTVKIYETEKATGSRVESFVIKTCKVKNGPGDNYTDIGEIRQNEIIIYNSRVVNGWCLAQKVSGMINYYDTRNAFWIKAENIYSYNRSNLPVGVITADKVKLSRITLSKGNLIRIIVRGDQKSYVIPDTIDTNFGITGWISNDSFTQDLGSAYYNQAYLRKGSTAYSMPDFGSEPATDFNNFMSSIGTDVFVTLTGKAENGFLHVRLPSGTAGWVREQDIYLPGGSGGGSGGGYGESPGGNADTSEPAGLYLDLNGDGNEDRIRFTTDGRRYTLTVNQSKAEGQGSGIQSEFRLVDINPSDAFYEIVIEEHGSGSDYSSTFFYYDGQRLVNMGKVPGLCGNTDAVKGDGIVRARARSSILETWYYTREYRLNTQHKLVESPSAFYEKIGYRNASPLRLKIESLPFLLSPGSNEVSFVLNRNETVRFVGSDNQRWCLFQTNDGRFGWLEVYDSRYIGGTGLHASDVFDGLSD